MPDLDKTLQPDSQVWFLSGTGIENYENQIDFRNSGAQRQWMIEHLLFTDNNYRYIRKNQSLLINKNVEQCYSIDYCFYHNRNFNGKYIYCYVTDVNYINDTTTEIIIEVDAWQTFQFDIEFQKCFVLNKHEKEFKNNIIAPENALIQNNLYPENLEYGNEYINVHTESLHWKNPYYILIGSTVELDGNYGTKTNPNMNASKGNVMENLPTMMTYYLFTAQEEFSYFCNAMSDYPWILQNINFCTVFPSEFINNEVLLKHTQTVNGKTFIFYTFKQGWTSNDFNILKITNVLEKFGLKQKHAKLYRYPYSYIELTGYNGQHFIIKPELLNSTDELNLKCITYLNSSPRFCIYPEFYNNSTDNGFKIDEKTVGIGDFIDSGIIFGDFPQVPVLVENSILYQAQNANSFALNNAIANYNKKEARFFNPLESGFSAVNNVLSGNFTGAFGSLYQGWKKTYLTDKQSDISIRKQMAKIQDAQITPPTLAGQTGGDGFNIANSFGGITLKWKTIHPRFIDKLNDFFERYGYTSNSFEIPVLRTNERFNFIRTQGCIIKSNIPKYYASIIQNMFDKGTTLWHDGNIGEYTTNNYEV